MLAKHHDSYKQLKYVGGFGTAISVFFSTHELIEICLTITLISDSALVDMIRPQYIDLNIYVELYKIYFLISLPVFPSQEIIN